MDMEATDDITEAVVDKNPERADTDGPYLQMIYYAVVGFFFNTLVMTQLPLISDFFGGSTVLFYIVMCYGGASSLIRVYLLWHYSHFPASTAERLSKLIHVGAIATSFTYFLYPISMSMLGKTNGGLGFWVCLGLACSAGIFNSLLINSGFTFMSIAPRKSAHFYILSQGAFQVVSWPLLMLLHFIVERMGGGYDTNYIVSVITLSSAGIITLGVIPLYRYRTRHHPALSPVLLDFEIVDEGQTRDILEVFRKIMIPATCAWLTALFTFMIYPSQISTWYPHEDAPYRTDQYQSFMIYIFAVADTIGRFVSKYIPPTNWTAGPRFLTLTCIRGIVMCPLIVMSSRQIPKELSSDWVRLLLIVFFGFTNGVSYSLTTISTPSKVCVRDKMTVGTILSFLIINAWFVGALIGIGLKYAVLE